MTAVCQATWFLHYVSLHSMGQFGSESKQMLRKVTQDRNFLQIAAGLCGFSLGAFIFMVHVYPRSKRI